jgi:hypothetical protein
MENMFVGAYWGARREKIEECASRLDKYLVSLEKLGRGFQTWYSKADTYTRAMVSEPINFTSKESLLELLDLGRNKRDDGDKVIEELGFRVSFWNKSEQDHAVEVTIRCGAFSTRVSNNAVLNLSIGADNPEPLLTSLLLLHAEVWEPDWVSIYTLQDITHQSFNINTPYLGKKLYVKAMGFIPQGYVSSTVATPNLRGFIVERVS